MNAREDYMTRMVAYIEARTDAALKDMHRAWRFPSRSAGQKRRRQRERAERTAPNLKITEV